MIQHKDIIEVTNTLVKEFNPVSIVVFGSISEFGDGNDLDLLVVTDDSVKDMRTLNNEVCFNLKDFYRQFSLDPFVISLTTLKEHYRKGSPFLQSILKKGLVTYMKDALKEWLIQAQNELEMANYLFKGGYFRGATFHSQQAIEKLFKVKLLEKGWELEKIHSTKRLSCIAFEYAIKINIAEEDLIFIDSIYRSRYPAEAGLLPMGEATESDANRAVTIAQNLFDTL